MDQEILYSYMDSKEMYRWDGPRGLENLKTLVRDLGDYESVEDFLIDNPGAIEHIVDWITLTQAVDWEESLKYATETQE